MDNLSRSFESLSDELEKKILRLIRLQYTPASPVAVEGFGFWTGADVRLEFHPAPPDTGIIFTRCDLPGRPKIPALVKYREPKPRQTSLVLGDARVDMVEHVLAALKALQIDNCIICTNAPEMPGCDGSSAPFVRALQSCERLCQPAIRNVRFVTEPFAIEDKNGRIDVEPNFEGKAVFHYRLNYGENNPIGKQEYRFELGSEAFIANIMSARTFLMKHEADQLLATGLCERVTPKDVLVFSEEGPIENSLHYENECVRHKVLDMVGDFSLCNYDIIGTFEARRSGHQLNSECLIELEKHSILFGEEHLEPSDERLVRKQRLLDAMLG